MDIVIIGPDILGLIILIILHRAIRMNRILDKNTLKKMETVTYIVSGIMILSIITTLLEGRGGRGIHMILRLANGIEFSLSPWTSYLFAIIQSEKIKSNWKKNVIPIVIGSCVAFLSIWTGWIFEISPENLYIRGELFFVNAIFNLYGFFLFIGANYLNRYRYEKEERRFLNWNYAMLSGGIVIQLLWEECLLLWPSVAFAVFSYYMFLNEMDFKYDALTQTYNRQAFQAKMEEIQKEQMEGYLAVVDLNGLKRVNDEEGHQKGDKYIRLSAEIVNGIIGKAGRVYRIGGDEFCIFCEKISEAEMEEKMYRIDQAREQLSDALRVPENQVGIAYGYEKCNVHDNVQDIFRRADQAMYEKKRQMKKV